MADSVRMVVDLAEQSTIPTRLIQPLRAEKKQALGARGPLPG